MQKWIEELSLLAHGYCLTWDPFLLLLHAVSDLTIALCYFAIPFAIWYYVQKRPDIELKSVAWLFVAFIMLCGLTHVMGLITLWQPIYVLQGTIKAMTAGVSLAAATAMILLMPKALAIPTPHQLQLVNGKLGDEIQAHKRTLVELQRSKDGLERRVKERTRDLERANQEFSKVFDEAPVAMMIVSADGLIERFNSQSAALFDCNASQALGKPFRQFVPAGIEAYKKHFRQLHATSGTSDPHVFLEETVGQKKSGVLFPADVGLNVMSFEKTEQFVASVFDLTERRQKEEQIELLMREVNHRSNNLLAVVQTIAAQTARETSGQEFADTLIRRLKSLSASQDLIIKGNWTAIPMRDLVSRQLEHLDTSCEKSIKIEGPEMKLSPSAAQGIGMALHELATNASKYGAFSNHNGSVAITWQILDTDAGKYFELLWQEFDGPSVVPPKRKGFGTIVIERMASHAVQGEVELVYAPEGIRWKLTAPLHCVMQTSSGVTIH